jgi:hypothetical protein
MDQSKRMDRELSRLCVRRKLMNSGLKIQSPKSMVKDQWFIDAIKDTPDYLYVSASFFAVVELIISVLVGHMPVRGSDAEFHHIIDAIREYHPQIPVFVFGTYSCPKSRFSKLIKGGHTHVRDCVTFDDHSIG